MKAAGVKIIARVVVFFQFLGLSTTDFRQSMLQIARRLKWVK
jgi:hypothetical protein